MQLDALNVSPLPMRGDLKSALSRAWSEVPRTGAWLTGEQRLAVAREARRAWACKLCQRRKQALSPYGSEGSHDSVSGLPEGWVETIHRIVTDSGRITEDWYDTMIATGILEDGSLTKVLTGADGIHLRIALTAQFHAASQQTLEAYEH